MTENRKRKAEIDGAEDFVVLKIPHSTVENGILREIIGEFRNIREEIKENRRDVERKFEEIRRKVEKKIMGKLTDILENIGENQKKTDKKLEEIRLTIEENQKVQNDDDDKHIPIRDAILGTWKMVHYENFEGYAQRAGQTLEVFSKNLKYELVSGKLKQTGGGCIDMIEGEPKRPKRWLYVDDNHVKSLWDEESTVDRYIENGKLHVVNKLDRVVWKRIYKKV